MLSSRLSSSSGSLCSSPVGLWPRVSRPTLAPQVQPRSQPRCLLPSSEEEVGGSVQGTGQETGPPPHSGAGSCPVQNPGQRSPSLWGGSAGLSSGSGSVSGWVVLPSGRLLTPGVLGKHPPSFQKVPGVCSCCRGVGLGIGHNPSNRRCGGETLLRCLCCWWEGTGFLHGASRGQTQTIPCKARREAVAVGR